MLFHVSIPADDPKRVAEVIAELWGGMAIPFPPFPASYNAMAGNDQNQSIEVYPRYLQLMPGDEGQQVQAAKVANPPRHSAVHAAIGTKLSEQGVLAIAAREGWTAKKLNRGGVFDLIEFWLEDSVMLEVLTIDMQKNYLERLTLEGWQAMLAAGAPH